MKKLLAVCLALIFPFVFTGCAAANGQSVTTDFVLNVINVGKADCLLIKSGDKFMLVDTGDADDEDTIRDYLDAQGVTRLEYVVATHPDKDHIGGMPWVLGEYEVGQVWICPLPEESKAYMSMVAAISAEGVQAVYPKAGGTAQLGETKIEAFSPTDALLATQDENECSIVLKLTHGQARFLLMGDAQAQAESWLIKSGYDLKADVIKIGHHGSDQSSAAQFISAVSPRMAAISCGYSDEDNYPSADTLNTLTGAGIDVKRTDIDGTIIYTTNGVDIQCSALGVQKGDAGYILDSKTNVFHLTTCPELPKKKWRVYYANREDAAANGGTPCPVCQP